MKQYKYSELLLRFQTFDKEKDKILSTSYDNQVISKQTSLE